MHRQTALIGTFVVFTFFLAAAGPSVATEKNVFPTVGSIERIDPQFNEIVGRGARLEKLAEGFDWSEGPLWIGDTQSGHLLFSDIPPNKIMKWDPRTRKISLFLQPSGYTGKGDYSKEPGSNGLLLDSKKRLILCQHGDRRIARLEKDGTFKTLADRYQGKRLNSPNDAIFKSNGDLYFTDPPYGLPNRFDSKLRELDFCGVYRLSTDGKLTLLSTELARPNGIAFSPDEKTLYVAQSDPQRAIWMSFAVKPDGTLEKGKLFYDATKWIGKKPGLPDGMVVDSVGNIFATGPGGVHVFNPEGKLLGTLNTGQKTANCTFGEDGHSLFITADMLLLKIRTKTKGLGF